MISSRPAGAIFRRRAPPPRGPGQYTDRVKVITTHLGADFDALGAVAGVLLLEPGARVVFPGSQEAAVRRFLAAEALELPEVRVRELRRARIGEATVVDCSSWRRLGEVGELIAAAGCPVRVVDHHPEGADAIVAAEVLTAPVAATCTVVVGELQRRDAAPPRDLRGHRRRGCSDLARAWSGCGATSCARSSRRSCSS